MILRKLLIGAILLTGVLGGLAIPDRGGLKSTLRESRAAELRFGLLRRRLLPVVTTQAPAPPTMNTSCPSGIDQSGFDKAVRPQDDLVSRRQRRVAEPRPRSPPTAPTTGFLPSWRKRPKTTSARSSRTAPRPRTMLPGSERQKVGDLYASFMDEARAEELGIRPIAARLAAVDAIQTKADLIADAGRVVEVRRVRPAGLLCGAPTRRSRTSTSLRSPSRAWACRTAIITGMPSSRRSWMPIKPMSSGC